MKHVERKILVIDGTHGTLLQSIADLPSFDLPDKGDLLGVGDKLYEVKRRKFSYDQVRDGNCDALMVESTVVLYVMKVTGGLFGRGISR